MLYTEEVRRKLDAILKAFGNYIDEQNYFDIVWSKKIGYLWIVVDDPGSEAPEQICKPEDLLDNLFNDIINDVVAPRQTTSLTEGRNLTEPEIAEVHRIAVPMLEAIPGSAGEYIEYLDSYIQGYQDGCCENGK